MIIHKNPAEGEAVTPCCGRTPFELPRTDRMTFDGDMVTCPSSGQTLVMPRGAVVAMYQVCCESLGIPAQDAEYTPPPPGSTEKQLPKHILALIVPRPYISTACETAEAIESAMIRYPDQAAELGQWRDRMHSECRINNKFTGRLCACPHHTEDGQ
jgi:hypothetical protein